MRINWKSCLKTFVTPAMIIDEPFNEENDSEPEEVTPTSGRGKRGRVADNTKGKKPKTSTGHWFHEQMGKIVEMNERTTSFCESISRREDNSGCSIKDVMVLVKECGAVPSTNEHFVASLVFTKRAEREMFMTLDTPEERSDSSSLKIDDSGSGSDEDWAIKTMALMRTAQNNLFATALVASKYYMTYHDKSGSIIPQQSGYSWTLERLNTGRTYKMFRMDS
ncbi:uncharacterized protein C2845_PM05G35470 [Panicum miliaceum]|uniref:Uncharacterized protein n=1 Tax=Panicum miliaceum TaxID=4540 RepID=A0A3L6SZD2_PANMI|nr:uncharacterized protein C2845_PM05G35470 [Panicum miliaceum]